MKSILLRFALSAPLLAPMIVLVTSCSSGEKIPEDLHEPVIANNIRHDLETIVIMGTNDIHGALAPISLKTKELSDIDPIIYERGGAAILAAHINILRSEFRDRFLILDAGDEFQGSIESNMGEGAPMVKFFNAIGINAAAVGNHEFDFGPVGPEGAAGDPLGALKTRMSEAKYPYVAANIVDRKTKKLPDLPNTLTRVMLKAGRLNVGVIGLSTLETPVSTRPDYIRSLEFTPLKEATLREAEALRKEGAQIIVINAHVGLQCDLTKFTTASAFRKPTDFQGECGPKDEFVKLLRSLPPGTIDAAVTGHSHQVVHNWIYGVPTIQGGTRNQYYNLLYLTYDWTEKKLLTERNRIEGPVPVCPLVFENQKDCNGERPAPKGGRGSLVRPSFHGKSIRPDSLVEQLLQPVFDKTSEEKARIIGHAARPLEHSRTQESDLGNLIADAIRVKSKADIALMNSGGIRASIESGPISFEAIFRVLPFDNSISVLTLTGKELKNILRIAESGARGFFPVSGVQLRLVALGLDAPFKDLNKNKRIEPWEFDRLIEIRLSNGAKIQDSKKYTLATVDFLVIGGDDFYWAMSTIPPERIQLNAAGLIRDAVIEYIGARSPINTVNNPLIDSQHPRFKFGKPKTKKS